jgi:hypothetical protein
MQYAAKVLGNRATLLTGPNGLKMLLSATRTGKGTFKLSIVCVDSNLEPSRPSDPHVWVSALWTTQQIPDILEDVAELWATSIDPLYPIELVYHYGGVLSGRAPIIHISKEIQQ